MIGATGPVLQKEALKEEDQEIEVIDVAEPAASPEHGLQVIESMSKMPEEMCSVCPFHGFDFQHIVDDHELTRGEPSLDSAILVLNDPPYNVRSGLEDASSHYYVLTLEGMLDSVALRNRVMKSRAQVRMVRSAL